MTVLNAPIEAPARRIEIGPERIAIRYADGSVLIDGDAVSESGRRTVDFFQISGTSSFVVTEERFRSDARRWGSVRDALAGREESQGMQRLFEQATLTAQSTFDAFRNAVDAHRFELRQADNGHWELRYTDPRTGESRVCRFSPGTSPTDGRLPRFDSITLMEDGLQIVITDEAQLAPLRPELDVLYRRLVAANRPR